MAGKLWCITVAVGFALIGSVAHAAAPFYEGKVIRIVVGATPGGGFDTYSRALTRHMRKHIPGNPSMIVENMPGAGFLIATNYMYAQAKPDGLTIGNWIGGMYIAQIVGRKGVEFDARKFEYLGAPTKNHDLCLMPKASGITSVEKWMAAKTPVKLGSTPPGGTPYDTAVVLREAVGLPMHLVSGYKGTADIRLAAEAGEVAGLCGLSWASAKSTWRKALESGDAIVILQNTPAAHPDLPQVPVAIKLAKTDEGRKLIQAGIHDLSAATYTYALPPGTPKDRVQLLRRAFTETLKDQEFLAEANKAKLEIDPVPGEELERIVAGLFKLDPAVIGKLKELLK